MKMIPLPDGTAIPALGQGTWMLGERRSQREEEIAALRGGIDLGMTLIDTAEMYGDGRSERLVGEAIAGRRDEVFLVSKAYPHHASRAHLPIACERSLGRLGTDRLDLYLLHWRGSVPLDETVEAMERLVEQGKIRRWGVSNLDADDMAELFASGGDGCATDQILYNLTRRGPEFDLMPVLERRQVPVMAYSPVEQGRLLVDAALEEAAATIGATPAQIALAWVMRRDDVIAIPKSSSIEHVRENRAAAEIVLDDTILASLDRAFPPPSAATPLAML